MFKLRHIKAIIHREIIGDIKTMTISKEPNGRCYAAIMTDDHFEAQEVSMLGKKMGIDVGLPHLAETRDGSQLTNPKHVLKVQKNL